MAIVQRFLKNCRVMKRVPDWLVTLLWAITTIFTVYAGWKVLSREPPMTDLLTIIQHFIAPSVLLVLTVIASTFDLVLGVFDHATIETWTFLGAAMVSGLLFLVAMCVTDAATKDNFLKAATGVGGFALGLKVGTRLDGASHASAAPSKSKADSVKHKTQGSKGKPNT
jgi:hypothetical protein